MKPGNILKERYLVENIYKNSPANNYYVGRDNLFSRRVIIEELPSAAATATLRRDFLYSRQRQILLDGIPGILNLYSAFEISGNLYSITEYPNGVSLRELTATNGRFSLKQTEFLIRCLAKGLDAAHRLNIFHGNLTPDCCFQITPGQYKIGGFQDIHGPQVTAHEQMQKIQCDIQGLSRIAGMTLLGCETWDVRSESDCLSRLSSFLPDYMFETIDSVLTGRNRNRPESVRQFLDRFLDESTIELPEIL